MTNRKKIHESAVCLHNFLQLINGSILIKWLTSVSHTPSFLTTTLTLCQWCDNNMDFVTMKKVFVAID